MTRSKYFLPVLFLFLIIPLSAFAGKFGDTIKGDVLPAILGVVSIAFGGGFLAKIKTIGKFKRAIKETTEAVQKIQSSVKDPATKKEVKEAIEAIADVLLDIGLKVEAEKMRKAVR